MQIKKLRVILPIAVASLSISTSLFTSPLPACAQNATYAECVQNLINLGVTPDVAATECRQFRGGNDDSSCIDRLMYTTARATSGPTDQGEWRFSQMVGSPQAMTAAGCRMVGFLGADGWRCPQQEMQFQVMSSAEAHARCNGLPVPSTTASSPFGGTNSRASSSTASHSFQVWNNTGRVIEFLYASPSGQNTWSNDLLGNNTVLSPGQGWNLTLTRGCQYDFWAEMENGSELFWRNINVCNRSGITLTP
jgi:hypothetical protein